MLNLFIVCKEKRSIDRNFSVRETIDRSRGNFKKKLREKLDYLGKFGKQRIKIFRN